MSLNLYSSQWQKELCESEDIEEYGLNEFIGGKAEAYEECKNILEKGTILNEQANKTNSR